jgi:hypothetical protein
VFSISFFLAYHALAVPSLLVLVLLEDINKNSHHMNESLRHVV